MEKIKIGLIDDHNLFREGIKLLLNKIPNIELIFEAINGIELLEKLKIHEPDVILLDLDMEKMNGIDATLNLHENYPDIKIIILTMHKEERMISYLMEIGAHGYLLKDTDKQELNKAINDVYENGFYFNPQISNALLTQVKQKVRTAPVLTGNIELTERELDVLRLIATEHTTSEIADQLYLSVRTIEGYRKNLLSKLGAKNSAGLIIKAIQQGIIEI